MAGWATSMQGLERRCHGWGRERDHVRRCVGSGMAINDQKQQLNPLAGLGDMGKLSVAQAEESFDFILGAGR